MEPRPSPSSGSSRTTETSRSAVGRAAGFTLRHPAGVAQGILFVLLAIVVLQNVEPTSIDILFWSFAAVPKLILIVLSMLAGALVWEIARRWLFR